MVRIILGGKGYEVTEVTSQYDITNLQYRSVVLDILAETAGEEPITCRVSKKYRMTTTICGACEILQWKYLTTHLLKKREIIQGTAGCVSYIYHNE